MVEPELPAWAVPILSGGMVLSFVVGVRLLRLASQTRHAPELALGAFALTMAVGNIGTVASLRWRVPLGPDHAVALGAAAQLVSVAGNVLLCFATRLIFQPHAKWALGGAIAASLALFGCWAASVVGGANPARLSDPRAAAMLSELARVAVFVWWSSESFRRALANRRRARFGLANPSITYRLELWAGFGVTGAVVHGTLLGMALFDEGDVREAPLVLAVVGAATLVGNVLIYASFFPPAFVRRWGAQRDTKALQVGDG
jgi:hypothetical protein